MKNPDLLRENDLVLFRKIRRTKPKFNHYITTSQIKIDQNKRKRIKNEQIEKFLSNLNVDLVFRNVNEAYYLVDKDKIVMPFKSRFKSTNKVTRQQNYYATLFHELVHWSGETDRLDRDSLYNSFAIKDFEFDEAVEEITAEIGCNYLLCYFGLAQTNNLLVPSKQYINIFLDSGTAEEKMKIFSKGYKQAKAAYKYLIQYV